MAPARRKWLLGIAVAVVVSVITVLFTLARQDYCRSALLLLQIEGGDHPDRFAQLRAAPVSESEAVVADARGPIRVRIYGPKAKSAPVLILVHGIHRLGIDEPRLVRFARAFAERGVLVVTPELRSLMEYRIEPAGIDEIGSVAADWAAKSGKPVAVMGISFGGGLALLAAANPRYAPSVSSVICIGAHDDLERVSRFFVTQHIQLPDGSESSQPAEQYGVLVLAYDHPEDLFSAADVSAARECLRLWLAENYDAARKDEAQLTSAGKGTMEELFRYQLAPIQNQLLGEIQKHAREMEEVSPHGKLGSLKADVFLLHGTEDEVIPSSETLWLEKEIPRANLKRALITPAVGHVDPETKIKLRDQWQLVSFMAAAFRELEHGPRAAVESRVVPSAQEKLPSSR